MRKLALLAAMGVALISCKKEEAQKQDSTFSAIENFGDLNVNPNFDWESAHENTLVVEGLEGATNGAKHMLSVTTPNGVEVYKIWTSIDQDHSLNFELADQHDYVTVQYGSITKKVEMKNRKGHFNYLVEDDRSDLDPIDR